jgi:hypothetical protein
LKNVQRFRIYPERSARRRKAGLIGASHRKRTAMGIKLVVQSRPTFNRHPTHIRYPGLIIVENQGAVIGEVAPETYAVAHH